MQDSTFSIAWLRALQRPFVRFNAKPLTVDKSAISAEVRRLEAPYPPKEAVMKDAKAFLDRRFGSVTGREVLFALEKIGHDNNVQLAKNVLGQGRVSRALSLAGRPHGVQIRQSELAARFPGREADAEDAVRALSKLGLYWRQAPLTPGKSIMGELGPGAYWLLQQARQG